MANLKEFVSSFNLEIYESRLREQGYDSAYSIFTLDEADLRTNLEIRDESERRRILDGVNSLDVRPWLEIFNLERFYDDMKACGISSVSDMKSVTEDLMDDMDILRAGCRKRMMAAVNLLKGSPCDENGGEVVAEGYWARPGPLSTDAQHDFLCVDGKLRGESGMTSETIVFMVDTGSDMQVTTKAEVIQELQLPFKRKVEIRGVHTAAPADCYSATLLIGNHELEVEVSPDSHDTVGNTVVRHFRHRIDSSSHKWIVGADS